jgi:peptidoglycan L-alanyl-D-glutamate endopeptidase CwlK
MSTKLESLMPECAAAAMRALADLKLRDIPYAVTSTLRTTAEQVALYAQGRESLIAVNAKRAAADMAPIPDAENRYTVTNCDGVKTRSRHQSGLAIDVVPLGMHGPEWPDSRDVRWEDIANSFEREGFEWGGRWKDFPDRPHYQFTGGKA